MLNSASDGPTDKYAQDRCFAGRPTEANLLSPRLPTNNEIEMIVDEKGKTHRLREKRLSTPSGSLDRSDAATSRLAITNATDNRPSFRTLIWHEPTDKPVAERESILRISRRETPEEPDGSSYGSAAKSL